MKILLATLLLMVLPSARAQSGGQGSGGSGGGSATKSTGTTTTTRPATIPPMQQERRPVFLTGRVMLDDGTVPSERVSIERVCGGQTRREAYVDSHGQFGFTLGGSLQVFQDASFGSSYDPTRSSTGGFGSGTSQPGAAVGGTASQGVTQQELMNCELRASAPGFFSDNIPLAGRQLFDNPDVGIIVLHRIAKVDGSPVSATSFKAPKEAKKAFERGQNLLKKGKKDEAASEFSKAIEVYPTYAEALSHLADLYVEKGQNEEAKKLYQRAIDADSHYLLPYFGMTALSAREQDWNATANFSERALALNAYQFPIAYFYNAVANYNLNKLDVAEKNARAARRLDSQHRLPRIDYLLANILIRRNDYAGAAEQLRSFLAYESSGTDAEGARKMLKDAEQRIASATPQPAAQNAK
ncbi:MAG: tetratricopeptide repeat protein [Terriglobales bacterium]